MLKLTLPKLTIPKLTLLKLTLLKLTLLRLTLLKLTLLKLTLIKNFGRKVNVASVLVCAQNGQVQQYCSSGLELDRQ